jgi:hypothetical protein
MMVFERRQLPIGRNAIKFVQLWSKFKSTSWFKPVVRRNRDENHVWMAPAYQVQNAAWRTYQKWSCVRAIRAVRLTTGPDGFRRQGHYRLRGLWCPRLSSVYSSLRLKVCPSHRWSCYFECRPLRRRVGRTGGFRQHGPDDASDFVRYGGLGEARGLAVEQVPEPRISTVRVVSDLPNPRGHAHDQQLSQVSVAHLRNSAETILPYSGSVLRC